MSRFFLLLILGVCLPYIASELSINTGIHGRSGYGYGYGDEGSSSSSASESSEESESSSESNSCETPRESCEDPSDKSGLYISNGAVNTHDAVLKPPSSICDCETGSRQFFTSVSEGTTTIRLAITNEEISYALDSSDAACPKLCIRDDKNKFWVPKEEPVVAYIVSNCVDTYCYNDMGLDSGKLKRVDNEDETFADTNADIDNAEIGVDPGTYMKVKAISCQGCDWISEEETSKCFARET